MSQPTPQHRMARMYAGAWVSWMIEVESRLGLADRLARGPSTVEELARATATRAGPLRRLLRSLTRVGILAEDALGEFSLTERITAMRHGFPGSLRAMAVMMGEDLYHAWDELAGRVCSDQTPIEHFDGKPVFEYLGDRRGKARVYDDAMAAFTDRTPRTVLENHDLHSVPLAAFNDLTTLVMLGAYDLSGVRVLADIGGGNGSNLIVALGRHPEMRGVWFDLPSVVEGVGECLTMAGLTGRCTAIGGDFFESIPVEADAYILRHILHEWDDDRAVLILRNVRRSMPEGARLLVIEHVLPPGDTPSFGALLDLGTLLDSNGVERTEAEFRAVLAAAGFRPGRIVPIRGDLSVVECERSGGP